MVDERFAKSQRLLRPEEFRRVFDRKCSVADAQLIVYGNTNDLGIARLGLTVSRKVGIAVRRNRWKRLIREAFRRAGDRLPAGVDLVVLPRRGARPNYRDLAVGLPRLARRVAQKLGRGEESSARMS